uniref:Zinc finger, CCHC-type n=1 Tax=Tanacetum cinerariifolium TaxID=118510 RepID=A0A699I3B0_TANCI|nr:hypothetical protein [Tanacetum cinerariifolium]
MAAATQNTNNMTIRSILQQEKLTRPNFTNWFQNLRIVLRPKGKLVHLEQPMNHHPYPVAFQDARDAYDALNDAQNEVACLMLGGWSVSKLLSLEDEELTGHCRTRQKNLVIDKTLAELHAMLKLHKKGIPKKAETPTMLDMWEERIQKDKKKPQGERVRIKERRRSCPFYHAELKKRNNASMAITSGIFMIELYAFPNKTWVYDTGCGTHICDTPQGLRESRMLKHEALSLYMRNGMRAVVEAIGSFNLILPGGLIIILDNYDFSCYGFVYMMKHKHETAARILNMVPTKKVDRTPYEIWHGKAPKFSYLRVWGCEALMK